MVTVVKIGRVLGLILGVGFGAGATAAEEVSGTALPDPRYTGSLALQEWTPEETGGKLQSFSILQDPGTGLIYAGNEAGVLEYDGARWRRLPSLPDAPPEGVVARGLAMDDQRRLWAAADNDVLIFTADARGHWRPESLRRRLPATEPVLGVVWDLCQQQEFMWAVTTTGIVRIDQRTLQIKRWPNSGTPALMGKVDGDIWFRYDGNRLLHVRDGEVEAAPVPALPDGRWILGVVRSAQGTLQADHAGGVLELRGNQWVPWSTEVDAALSGPSAASRVCRLPDGGRIFSTRSRTLVVVDANGRVRGRHLEPPGVNFGVTPRTMLDRDGGLWLANASGLRRVQIDALVVRHGAAQGLRGGARKLAFDGPRLLAASAQGLFVRDPATGVFKFQEGSPSDQQALLPSPAGGWLMAAGQNFGEWRAGAMVRGANAPAQGLSLAADPHDRGRVLIGTFNEIHVYRRGAESWQREATLSGTLASLYYAASEEAGAVWYADGLRPGLWRVTPVQGDWSKATIERLDGRPEDSPPRMPAAPWRVETVAGEALGYGAHGIWRAEKPGGRLVPDDRFAGLPQGAATSVAVLVAGRDRATVYVAGAKELRGRVWRGMRKSAAGPWEFSELPLAEVRSQLRLEHLQEAPDGRTLWLSSQDAAYSVDLAAPPLEFRVPAAIWRGVRILENDELLFGGAGVPSAVALPAGRRAVAVEFAAPAWRMQVGGRTGIEYRTRAAGVDPDWTVWSAVATRELTNLPPGTVQLEVQARNHLGASGPVAALTLIVPPFWWETWWLRIGAGLAAVAVVAAAVRALVRRQYQQRIALLEAQAALQQERLRIARDMHDDLGSTLASIVHLSAGAEETRGADESRLARIHAATRDLMHRARDIVWAAAPQHDSLESLVEQLSAHAERILGDRGVQVRVELPALVPDERVDAAVRHGVFLAFKEAVNNAAKYAQARTATVRIELTPQDLVVTLKDDGVGFAPGERKGSGFGLENLRSRLSSLGGAADIVSVVGQGTTVTFRLPRVRT